MKQRAWGEQAGTRGAGQKFDRRVDRAHSAPIGPAPSICVAIPLLGWACLAPCAAPAPLVGSLPGPAASTHLSPSIPYTPSPDMCSRTPYYLAVLRLAHMLGRHGKACSLLWRQAPGSRLSVAGLLQSMLQPAQQYARVTQPIYDREIEERSQSAATVAAAVAAGAPPPAPLPPKSEGAGR